MVKNERGSNMTRQDKIRYIMQQMRDADTLPDIIIDMLYSILIHK